MIRACNWTMPHTLPFSTCMHRQPAAAVPRHRSLEKGPSSWPVHTRTHNRLPRSAPRRPSANAASRPVTWQKSMDTRGLRPYPNLTRLQHSKAPQGLHSKQDPPTLH